MNNIKVQREILLETNNNIDIGITGNFDNHALYNKIYDEFIANGGTEKEAERARSLIGDIYATKERTSNTGKTYEKHYSDYYDAEYASKD